MRRELEPAFYYQQEEDSGSDISADRWIMGVSAIEKEILAVKEGYEYIVLDSGSGEHVCPDTWHPEKQAQVRPPSEDGPLRDVQGGILDDQGAKTVKMSLEGETSGGELKLAVEFVVAKGVREPIFSWGKLLEAGAEMETSKNHGVMRIGGIETPITLIGKRTYVQVRSQAPSSKKANKMGAKFRFPVDVAPVGPASE